MIQTYRSSLKIASLAQLLSFPITTATNSRKQINNGTEFFNYRATEIKNGASTIHIEWRNTLGLSQGW